jgi:hypothetical protein
VFDELRNKKRVTGLAQSPLKEQEEDPAPLPAPEDQKEQRKTLSPINIRSCLLPTSSPPFIPRGAWSCVRFSLSAARETRRNPGGTRALGMSPPMNGAVSLAYPRAGVAGGLLPAEALLLPFDGFTTEDLLLFADPAPLNQQQPLLLLPSSSATSGCCHATPASPEVTTAAVTAAADATSSRAPPSPVHATGHRTSSFRGVTRYVISVACRWRGRGCSASTSSRA